MTLRTRSLIVAAREWNRSSRIQGKELLVRQTMLRLRSDCGAATAEYAITIMAAVGFAGLLVVILRSDEVRGILTDMVRGALSIG